MYNFSFTFRLDTVSTSDILEILNDQLDFKPDRINFKKFKDNPATNEQVIASFLELENKIRFDTKLLDGGVLNLWKKKRDYLSLLSKTLEFPTSPYIDKKVQDDNFLSLFIFDLGFVLMQDEKLLNNYRAFQKPYDHLRIFKSIDGTEYVDTSSNPGRTYFDQESGFEFMACWKMWFGKEIRSHLTGKPVEDFPGAYKIQQLPNDVVYVQLYENVEDTETAAALKVMQDFRDWVNCPDETFIVPI